jgi:hypothetical protein
MKLRVYNPERKPWRHGMSEQVTVADVNTDVATLKAFLSKVRLWAEHTCSHPLGRSGKVMGRCKLTAEHDERKGWRAVRQTTRSKDGGWTRPAHGDWLSGVVAVWTNHDEGKSGHLFVSTLDGAYYSEGPAWVIRRIVSPPPYFSPPASRPELGLVTAEGEAAPRLKDLGDEQRKSWVVWEYEVGKIVREVMAQVLRSKQAG